MGKPEYIDYSRWDDARYLMALIKLKRFRIIRAYHDTPTYSNSPYWIVEPMPGCMMGKGPHSEADRKLMRLYCKAAWKQKISTDVAERIINSKYVYQSQFHKWSAWEWNVRKFPVLA